MYGFLPSSGGGIETNKSLSEYFAKACFRPVKIAIYSLV
jgi:hypothetical protein